MKKMKYIARAYNGEIDIEGNERWRSLYDILVSISSLHFECRKSVQINHTVYIVINAQWGYKIDQEEYWNWPCKCRPLSFSLLHSSLLEHHWNLKPKRIPWEKIISVHVKLQQDPLFSTKHEQKVERVSCEDRRILWWKKLLALKVKEIIIQRLI